MQHVYRLRNPIQNYAWGSHHTIAELLGRPSPTPHPQAELWIGAHPRGRSIAIAEVGEVTLDQLVSSGATAVLGQRAARTFKRRLPFLLKVLAVEKPLSLQAHPDRRQAKAGFRREKEAGIALDAPRRNYRDKNHKPELVHALSPFEALYGFRPAEEALAGLEDLAVPGLAPWIDFLHGALQASAQEGAVEEATGRLFLALIRTSRAEQSDLVAAVQEAVAERLKDFDLPTAPPSPSGEAAALPTAAEPNGSDDGEVQSEVQSSETPTPAPQSNAPAELLWLDRLARSAPHDAGALAPLLLHYVRLEPGEALFTEARVLHAYLSGTAIELQASSDNVLRGGLTEKHIDTEELARVLDLTPRPPEIHRGEARGSNETVFEVPVRDFELSRIDLDAAAAWQSEEQRAVEILLCTEGNATLVAGEKSLSLRTGQSVLVAAAGPTYTLEGEGCFFRATVGRRGPNPFADDGEDEDNDQVKANGGDKSPLEENEPAASANSEANSAAAVSAPADNES